VEIYLDANATTLVLSQARAAALEAMAENYGNPSSVHTTGLKARALVDSVRALARQALGMPTGRVVFVSGATEGIQTAVLSALNAWRDRPASERQDGLLLYGATEHKAVPESLRHWNSLLGTGLQVLAIPVGRDGLHDLGWLRHHAPRAALVCTMAANNETGVISDIDGIAAALGDSQTLWMVDSVQALGKLPTHLASGRIDYAPFSGHKLYAPKGIGMLYVREGVPFTPLIMGGGQEGALRSGTENMPGIAAFGAVLKSLVEGGTFQSLETLHSYRNQLVDTLREAFPGILFNAPLQLCLPTTLNFSVPGVGAKLLLDLFDAGGIRVSGGSACSSARAEPSHVLEAMGLPQWRAASAVRLSFGPVVDSDFVTEACERILACGRSLNADCLDPTASKHGSVSGGITRFAVDGACCYVLCDAGSRRCVVIDPLPELVPEICKWLSCFDIEVTAVLDTHSRGDSAGPIAEWRRALTGRASQTIPGPLGWLHGAEAIELGATRLLRLDLPNHMRDAVVYLAFVGDTLQFAFVGETLQPGALGQSEFARRSPEAFAQFLRELEGAVGRDTLLLPSRDDNERIATTLGTEFQAQSPMGLALSGSDEDLTVDSCSLRRRIESGTPLLVVDVREPYEQRVEDALATGPLVQCLPVPLSRLVDALPGLLQLPEDAAVIFICRSGHRSLQAAAALRRLGHKSSFSLEGGIALWPRKCEEPASAPRHGG